MVLLERATIEDAQALAQVHADAFATERVTQLKSIDASYVHRAEMLPAIEYWLGAEGTVVIKAVDPTTREILGWACWRLAATASTAGAIPEPTSDAFPKTPAGVGKFTGAHMSYWIQSLVPKLLPSPHRILISITIAPAHQRGGVGSALLQWGLADQLPTWVHASEMGHPFFARHGFTVRASVTVLLAEWAQGAPPPMGYESWGTTTFRYMTYLPKGET
ncbi:hypothetical protein ACHHYP_02631 [Achlya hypogyna]|uniref:N-acetyltransferase domain-containing protein n=1 Tax=Achlya hypogyna TaxID=1202772 RepID=A0A1V9Z5R3_ACHHY|nr:hypothetical protein ACHHYP_02631 [Achlya hypogyna]